MTVRHGIACGALGLFFVASCGGGHSNSEFPTHQNVSVSSDTRSSLRDTDVPSPGSRRDAPSSPDTRLSSASGSRPITGITLDVDDVMNNPAGYLGEIAIRGVVSAINSEQHLVNVIDVREYDACREVGCATLILPIEWHGDMPVVGTHVKIAGRIINRSGKFVVTASELETASR